MDRSLNEGDLKLPVECGYGIGIASMMSKDIRLKDHHGFQAKVVFIDEQMVKKSSKKNTIYLNA